MLSETLKRVRVGFATRAKQTPVLVMAGFLLGVAIHSAFPLTPLSNHWWWILSLSVAASLSLFICKERFAMVFWLSASCLVGLWRFDVAIPIQISSQDVGTHQGTVAQMDDGMYGKQALVDLDEGLWVQISLKQNVDIGSTVSFACALKPTLQKEGELDRRFASNLHRTQARCTAKDVRMVAGPVWWDARQSFSVIRDWTNARVSAAMPGDEGALIAGMLYGERGLSQEAKDRFKRAGLTHLIAVSGSNITIVASVIFGVLMAVGMRRKRAFWATTVALAAYVTFAGFSASVARAAIMGWLVLLANHVGRIPRTAHVLLVSASLLNLLDPWMLAYDAGFALSFLATLGLMAWSPVFGRRLEWLPESGGIRESAATTLGATIMTLPYMSFTFERASLAGLFTNVLAVPLVPFAMLFGAVGVAWGNLPGSQYVSLPAMGVAKTIFAAAKIADILPWLDIHMERADFFMCAATYLLLAIIYFSLRGKKGFSTTN